MADAKISELPAATLPLARTELLAIVQGGESRRVAASALDPWNYVVLASSALNSTTASIDTALAFTPPPNRLIIFESQLFLQSAATTTGARPGIKWPTGGILQNIARAESPNSASGASFRFWGAPTAANAPATGVAVANESIYGAIEGSMVTGPVVTGNLIITIASEIAASEARMMANSWLRWRVV